MSRPSRVRALALLALTAAAGCQDYNFNPVGHCLIQPGTQRVKLSDVSTADVLFVVDDSGSMGGEQQKLSDNFSFFIQNLSQTNVNRVAQGQSPIDFHLAVTTTSIFYNAPAGALCRSDCPGAAGAGPVCCNISGTTPTAPLKAVQTCSGDADTSCIAGACRNDCKTFLGEYVCCDPGTKVPVATQEIACETVDEPCGDLRTHYQWNAASPTCDPGSAAGQNERPYPQGRFVGLGGNPRVIHFDKQLYSCGTPPCTTNSQGYTAAQLQAFFTQNVVAGTCGSGEEQGLQAGRLAVQKALAGEQRDTVGPTGTPGDAPAAWPHDASKLVLVFVGDEDDCSSPQSASAGIVLSGDPGTDTCQLDQAKPADQQKEFSVASIVDYFTGLPGDRPLGAAFIVSARSSTANNYCQDETCTADICCDTACTGSSACTSNVCGGQAKGTRLLEAANQLRARNADVVSGSICDPNFNVILNRIAEIVKPPSGLLLPSQPAAEEVAVLRIARADGKTRKTCNGPAPATLDAAGAKAAGYDWWFTASREQVTPDQQHPTAASRYVYINHDTLSCEASPGESYSADYLGRLPAQGCAGATVDEADASCVSTLGGRAGDWTCFAGTDAGGACLLPTGGAGGLVGTCLCGARGGPAPVGSPAGTPGTGNCPNG
jgi:hypothetical protein